MDNLDWLHSPTLSTTMDRLIRQYTCFLEIIFKKPGQMAVPTLGVDLAWHTPISILLSYNQSISIMTIESAKGDSLMHLNGLARSINSSPTVGYTANAPVGIAKLHGNTILYSGNTILSSSTRHSRTLAKDIRVGSRISSEPDENAHISTHQAVRSGIETSVEKEIRRERLRKSWVKASRRDVQYVYHDQ